MIVIGAGASGLGTAKQLHNFGMKVQVQNCFCNRTSGIIIANNLCL